MGRNHNKLPHKHYSIIIIIIIIIIMLPHTVWFLHRPPVEHDKNMYPYP